MQRGQSARQTADRIRDMILEGRFEDGAPLRQSRLAEELGVSRVPLREAFQLLETEGLVALRSNRGAIVSLPSPREIEQRAEMRAQIEGWLAQTAARYATEADIAKLEAAQAAMETCSDEDWSRHNIAFHEALLAPANRPHVIEHLRALHQRLFQRFGKPIISVRARQRQLREHAEILDCFRRCDGEALAAHLETHIIMSARPAIDHILNSRRSQNASRSES